MRMRSLTPRDHELLRRVATEVGRTVGIEGLPFTVAETFEDRLSRIFEGMNYPAVTIQSAMAHGFTSTQDTIPS